MFNFITKGYYEVYVNDIFISKHIKPEKAQAVLLSELIKDVNFVGYIKFPERIEASIDFDLLNEMFKLNPIDFSGIDFEPTDFT